MPKRKMTPTVAEDLARPRTATHGALARITSRWSRKPAYDGFSTKPAPAPQGPPMNELIDEARRRRRGKP